MSDLELKRCPFCESRAEIDTTGNSPDFTYGVVCMSEDCYACIDPVYSTPEEAAEAWNNRIVKVISEDKWKRVAIEYMKRHGDLKDRLEKIREITEVVDYDE